MMAYCPMISPVRRGSRWRNRLAGRLQARQISAKNSRPPYSTTYSYRDFNCRQTHIVHSIPSRFAFMMAATSIVVPHFDQLVRPVEGPGYRKADGEILLALDQRAVRKDGVLQVVPLHEAADPAPVLVALVEREDVLHAGVAAA